MAPQGSNTNPVRTYEQAFNFALQLLTRLGQRPPKWRDDKRPPWSTETMAEVKTLLLLYFFGPVDQIANQEQKLANGAVMEVRRRFAGACCQYPQLSGTAGQAQPWFPEMHDQTRQFLASQAGRIRKARKSGQ